MTTNRVTTRLPHEKKYFTFKWSLWELCQSNSTHDGMKLFIEASCMCLSSRKLLKWQWKWANWVWKLCLNLVIFAECRTAKKCRMTMSRTFTRPKLNPDTWKKSMDICRTILVAHHYCKGENKKLLKRTRLYLKHISVLHGAVQGVPVRLKKNERNLWYCVHQK